MISRKWLAALASLVIVVTALLTGPVAYADEDSVNFEDAVEKATDLARARANGDISLDRLIVIYDRPSSTNDAQRSRVRQQAGAKLLSADRTLARDVLRVSGGNAAAVAQVLRRLPGVLDAYPDLIARVTVPPNDPLWPEPGMYGLRKIQAEVAWDTSLATDVRVAVLDCGIHAAHEDLAAKVVLANDIAGSGNTDDKCNHGTHVAGTIAANTNNSVGVASVAPGALLLNGKVLGDNGSGSFADIDFGIKWAADNGAKVINLSLGAKASCPTGTANAVAYARSKGAVVVAAAGNANESGAITPANCPFAVGVAATDQNDNKASFSNFGPNVDVAAPGVAILSTVNPALNGGSNYRAFSGTSMASPHAAGVAALIFTTTYATGATPEAIADAVVDRLFATTDPIAAGIATHGRVNAAKAVAGGSLAPGFTLSLSPSSREVGVGGATTEYTVTLTRTGGFDADVALSVSGLPLDAAGSLTPSTLSGTAATSTSTLSVTTAATTPAGTSTLTVTGTGGGLTQTASATLQVTDFTISISPATGGSVPKGGSTTYTIGITRTPGSSAAVDLAVLTPPAGLTFAFSPDPASGDSSLTVTAAADALTGTTSFTVTGTALGLSRSSTAEITVTEAPDFSLVITPVSQTIGRGDDPTYLVTIERLNGFAGSVTFTVAGLPARSSASFSPNPASGESSTLKIKTSARVPRGTFTLTVTGTSGGLTRTVKATLIIE